MKDSRDSDYGPALEYSLRALIEDECERDDWLADRPHFPNQSGQTVAHNLRVLVHQEVKRLEAAKAERLASAASKQNAEAALHKTRELNNPKALWPFERVCEFTGMSPRVVAALAALGRFPSPVAVGERFAFIPAEVEDWATHNVPPLINHIEVRRRTGLPFKQLGALVTSKEFPAPSFADWKSIEWLPGRIEKWLSTTVALSRNTRFSENAMKGAPPRMVWHGDDVQIVHGYGGAL